MSTKASSRAKSETRVSFEIKAAKANVNATTNATDPTEPCGPCKREKCEEPAFCWCIDCTEALCEDCDRHHKKSKISVLHKTIPIQKLKVISDFLRNFSQTCCDHPGGKVTFYCTSHDKLCCPTCVTSHQKECNDIMTLDDASSDAKKNGIIEELGQRMKEAFQTLNELETHKKENVSMINAQRDDIVKCLAEMRRKINEYFDSLERRMTEKLTQAHKECIEKLEAQTKDLEKRTEVLKTWQTDIKTIKDFGSEVHAFVMSKGVENLVRELEAFNRVSTENFIGLNLTFVASTTAENLHPVVSALGEISVNKSSTELVITSRKSARPRSKIVEK